MRVRACVLIAALAAAGALGGCSGSSGGNAPTAAGTAAAPANPRATDDLNTYRELLRIGNDQLATTMGHQIEDRYPGSAAAKEVAQSLPRIEARYLANAEKNRLAALWTYQTAPMAGGIQSTAAIFNSTPTDIEHVRLVLRKHTSWGQSVFLYGSGKGFVCKGVCTLAASFDGKRHPLKAYLPPTGEPAIFIKDDVGFIAALRKAKKIVIPVVLKDGDRKVDLLYEVGGYDPAKWVAVKLGK